MTRSDPLPIALLIAHDYPPFGGSALSPGARWVEAIGRDGRAVEVIAPSDSEEEFVHLDASGNLVHRIAGSRSYAFGVLERLAPALASRIGSREVRLAARAAEKILERTQLWNRRILWSETLLSELALVAPAVASALWQLRKPSTPAASPLRGSVQTVDSIDLVICTYGRFEELVVSIDSALGELASTEGVETRLRVLYQDADLLDRLRQERPDLLGRPEVSFELSQPPSLTGARNLAIAGSSADLIVFIDDDVKLRTGFLTAYREAAQRSPEAIGFAGRIQSPSERKLGQARAIGQIRLTGHVDVNYNSDNGDAVYVPTTPMGANMAFRRERMNRLFGTSWFDPGLTGSAIREESTLALEVNRAGEHLVFVPGAALEHFEARRGGCGNRDERSPWEHIQHRALETLFLARLHQGTGLLHASLALRAAARDAASAAGPLAKLGSAAIHLAGYLGARRRYRAAVAQKRRALVPGASRPGHALLRRTASA
jgi:hypothetical protein